MICSAFNAFRAKMVRAHHGKCFAQRKNAVKEREQTCIYVVNSRILFDCCFELLHLELEESKMKEVKILSENAGQTATKRIFGELRSPLRRKTPQPLDTTPPQVD